VLTHPTDDPAAAARAIKAGATEFLVCDERLVERVDTMLRKTRGLAELHREQRALREQNTSLRKAAQERFSIVGSSPQMEELRRNILRAALVPRPVLVVGERGTGKELVARALHDNSERASKPFVAVNCAALPESLIETELFGHEKGAFTGAETRRQGKFEEADQGTIFLDEIGSMSLVAQHKILRVAEYGTLRRVGAIGETRVNVRIISATNADLTARMREGAFLPDLYDRITFEVLRVPALRERISDLPLLSQYFLDGFMREIPAFRGKRLTSDALRMLEAYDFPGNVRELKNIIERAVCRDTTNEISPDDIGLISNTERRVEGSTYKERVANFERNLLADALRASGGNQSRAARLLGMTYHQFRHHHQKLNER
jgi:DNA-binding NtrC family response regulator